MSTAGMLGVAAVIRERRTQVGLTQRTLSGITGVPIRDIGRIEGASGDVSFARLASLAWWLDLHLSFTLAGKRK